MIIRAGKLDRTITVERRHDIISAAGSMTPVWTAHATVRAEIVEPEIVETANQDGTAEAETLTFRLRFLAITPADRVRFDDRIFDIIGVKELGRRRGSELRCKSST
jgi:head-tail adaptor